MSESKPQPLNDSFQKAVQDTTNTRGRLRAEQAWFWILRVISGLNVAVLVLILWFLLSRGLGKALSWEFLSQMPREAMTEGGILPAIVGTLILTLVAMVVAIPIGILSAIYLNEYAKEGRTKRTIRLATNNLAGVPSVVFGLFGMALFVKGLGFGTSILAGGLTLALVALPVIIRTSEEALKSVPKDYRQGSLALGATQWQTIRHVVLPAAASGILTGSILSVGRVAGETAPILFTAAAYFLPRLPHSLLDQVMALPYHLYVLATSGTEIEKSRPMAYGTAVVLLFLVLCMNLAAVYLRQRFRKQARN
jgi:phosphate transport system permease protein